MRKPSGKPEDPAYGQNFPPVLRSEPLHPPQIIICEPVQIAVWEDLFDGADTVEVGSQMLVVGLYLPPVGPAELSKFSLLSFTET